MKRPSLIHFAIVTGILLFLGGSWYALFSLVSAALQALN